MNRYVVTYLIKREIAKNLELYLALLNIPVAIYITIIFVIGG